MESGVVMRTCQNVMQSSRRIFPGIVPTQCSISKRTCNWVTSGGQSRWWKISCCRNIGSRTSNSVHRAFSSKCNSASRDSELTANEASPSSYVWQENKGPRICILGGGFGGLYTALRLESLVWPPSKRPQILLVDQSDRFVFKPLLYELLSKEVDKWEIAPLFTELLGNSSIRFLKDTVTAVSPSNLQTDEKKEDNGGRVQLASGIQVDYDWLVLALGAESKTDLVPGASECALPFASLEDVVEVDRRLRKLERNRFGLQRSLIDVVVVGSGYCGIELSATLSERLGDRGRVKVVDINTEICRTAPTGNRESALKVLKSRDVELQLGFYVTEITRSDCTGDGDTTKPFKLEMKAATSMARRNPVSSFIEADLVLWTVGSKPVSPPGPFPVTGRGQADTDETLRVKGHPRIFAIGDSAFGRDNSGSPLPATAQVALQQADYAGWNVWASINHKPLLPFKYQHLGEMMTLGRYDAAVTPGFLFTDVTLDGILGHTARKLAYLYRLPTNEHRLKVGLSWFTKSTVDAVSYVQNTLLQFAK